MSSTTRFYRFEIMPADQPDAEPFEVFISGVTERDLRTVWEAAPETAGTTITGWREITREEYTDGLLGPVPMPPATEDGIVRAHVTTRDTD